MFFYFMGHDFLFHVASDFISCSRFFRIIPQCLFLKMVTDFRGLY